MENPTANRTPETIKIINGFAKRVPLFNVAKIKMVDKGNDKASMATPKSLLKVLLWDFV